MKRVLALLVLLALVAAGVYLMKYRSGEVPPVTAQNLEGMGDKVGEKLGGVGEKLGEIGDKVGDKLRSTKTTGSVKAALELNRNLKPLPIEVSAEDTVVTLRGEVPSEELKRQAERVAASVPDVTQVKSELRVNPALAPAPAAASGDRTLGENIDDKALEAKVNLAFSLNKDLKGTDMSVRSYRREVTLGGQVATEAQRQIALQIARETPDVLSVKDEVRAGGAAGTTAPAPGAPSPASAGAVEAALAANPNLAAYGLKVRDDRGRLTLTGTVRTATEKDLAAMVAKEAASGAAIQNEIVIRP